MMIAPFKPMPSFARPFQLNLHLDVETWDRIQDMSKRLGYAEPGKLIRPLFEAMIVDAHRSLPAYSDDADRSDLTAVRPEAA